MEINYDKLVKEWSNRLNGREPIYTNRYHKSVLRDVMKDFGYPLELVDGFQPINEAEFTPKQMAKTKYQPQWLDYINNGESFDLEPSGQIIIKRSFLDSNGNGSKTFRSLLSGGTQTEFEDFFKKGNVYDTIIPGEDGKMYKLPDISKSTFTSQGGGDIPRDAATYEMGICMAHAIHNKGLTYKNALKKVKIKNVERYEKFREEVENRVGKKIASDSSIKSLPLIEHTGQGLSDSVIKPYSNNTPKTDIMATKAHRISLKKKGGSQLTSATGPEARGLFEGAKSFWGAEEDITGLLDDIIQQVEDKFTTITGDQEVGQIRNRFKEYYLDVREPDVRKEAQGILDKLLKVKEPNKDEKDLLKQLTGKLSGTSLNDKGVQDHIKAEAAALGLLGGGDKPKWFIPNVTVMKPTTTSKLFKDFLKTYDNADMKEEARKVLETAIDHKNLKPLFDSVWSNDNFKKWVVYEAATGNFKFSGDSKLDSNQDSIANEIMVFDLNGNVNLEPLDVKWANKHKSKVTSTVGYKSAGRSKNSSWRLSISENVVPQKNQTIFEHKMNKVIKKETKKLNDDINVLVDSYVDILEEGFFDNIKKKGKQLLSKVKKLATKLLSKITEMIKNFWNKVLKKAIENIKEFAKKGFDVLVDALGIEITGSADVGVSF